MSNESLYFFVMRDGTECCSNIKPRRVLDYIEKYCVERKTRYTKPKSVIYEQHKDDASGWYTNLWDSDYGEFQGTELCEDDIVYLPDGFIEKVTGKKMCFEDEPYLFDPKSLSNNKKQ